MMQTETDLDRVLAEMAEEAPPMPADFHNKWMQAIREEAENKKPETKPAKPAVVSQWRRILSAAAVFVFLIGGTVIYRSTKKRIVPVRVPANTDTTTNSVQMTEEAGPEEQPALQATPAVTQPVMDTAGEVPPMMDTAAEAPPMMDTAGEVSGEAYEAYYAEEAASKAAGSEQENAAKEIETAGETSVLMYEEESMEEEEKPAAEDAGTAQEKQADVAEATGRDQAEAETADNEPAAETEADAGTGNEANREGIGGFLADMGEFLLKALPYLLGAAALALVGVLLHRRKKQTGK